MPDTTIDRPEASVAWGEPPLGAVTAAARRGAEQLASACHVLAARAGWWSDPAAGAPCARPVPELLMLAVSGLGEAMEAHRKGLRNAHLPHRPGLEVGVADAVIRLCDLAGGLGFDLPGAIAEKLAFDHGRADRDLAARLAAGGERR